jgi:hypothetical protein
MPDPLFDRDDDANTPLTAEERERSASDAPNRHERGVLEGERRGRRRV